MCPFISLWQQRKFYRKKSAEKSVRKLFTKKVKKYCLESAFWKSPRSQEKILKKYFRHPPNHFFLTVQYSSVILLILFFEIYFFVLFIWNLILSNFCHECYFYFHFWSTCLILCLHLISMFNIFFMRNNLY